MSKRERERFRMCEVEKVELLETERVELLEREWNCWRERESVEIV